jgi:hypothetical protein
VADLFCSSHFSSFFDLLVGLPIYRLGWLLGPACMIVELAGKKPNLAVMDNSKRGVCVKAFLFHCLFCVFTFFFFFLFFLSNHMLKDHMNFT